MFVASNIHGVESIHNVAKVCQEAHLFAMSYIEEKSYNANMGGLDECDIHHNWIISYACLVL